jgi:hypothetical protein
VCVCVFFPINFQMTYPIFMKLGSHITSSKAFSKVISQISSISNTNIIASQIVKVITVMLLKFRNLHEINQ